MTWLRVIAGEISGNDNTMNKQTYFQHIIFVTYTQVK